jgi:hypothetical protein
MARVPTYGDEVIVPSQHPDGHWVNGIVNSGYGGRQRDDGNMLIAAPGHRYSSTLLIPLDSYGEHWLWPEDKGMKPSGVKLARLDEVEG